MHIHRFTHFIIPILLLIAAAIVNAWAIHLTPRDSWTPVTVPIDLRPGVVRTPAFQVDLADQYIIELAVNRDPRTLHLACLLGIQSNSEEECNGVPSPVNISWQATANGIAVASGETNPAIKVSWGSWGTKEVSRTIGVLDCEPNKVYVLEIRSRTDVSILNALSPRIIVSVNPGTYKDQFVKSAIVRLVALLLGAVGGLWLLILIARYLWLRRKRSPDGMK